MSDRVELRQRFAELHRVGTFLMPNVWDAGSARLFASLGFPAIATTSSGFAATLGRHDQTVTRDELVAHVAAVTAAVDIPLSVDAEDGYGDSPSDLADTVEALADAGASGISIEDHRTGIGVLDVEIATERVAAYVDAANRHELTVTARAENHLYDIGDLDDTIGRLRSYVSAGAHVVYAPSLTDVDDLGRVVTETVRPVNALLLPNGPTVAELGSTGIRRISTGGALAFVAYGAAARAARELIETGTQSFAPDTLTRTDRDRAFG